MFKDENFLKFIRRIENLVSKVLSITLIVVILVSLVELIIVLGKDLFYFEPIGFFARTLLEIFGLFLNILIPTYLTN